MNDRMSKMKHTPITKQRSDWYERMDLGGWIEGKYPFHWFQRSVSDGILLACVAIEPQIGWHMSISFRTHKGKLTRYPTWDEIAHAREVLLPVDVGFVMHLPLAEEYVALHSTTFHLHQHPEPEGDLP